MWIKGEINNITDHLHNYRATSSIRFNHNVFLSFGLISFWAWVWGKKHNWYWLKEARVNSQIAQGGGPFCHIFFIKNHALIQFAGSLCHGIFAINPMEKHCVQYRWPPRYGEDQLQFVLNRDHTYTSINTSPCQIRTCSLIKIKKNAWTAS